MMLHLAEGWELFRGSIKTDEPHEVDMFLGCKHVQFERTLPETGKKVRGIEYDMSDFLMQCVERYKELTNVKTLRKASTPFLAEPTKPDMSDPAGSSEPELSPDEALRILTEYVEEFEGKTVSDKESASSVPSSVDVSNTRQDDEPNVPLNLSPYAARVLMKV